MPSRVPLRDRTLLEAMHTGSLLSHMRKLQACEESFTASDRDGCEAAPDPLATGFIEFKDCDEWREAHRIVTDILAQREHRPTAEERRIKRVDRVQSIQTKGR